MTGGAAVVDLPYVKPERDRQGRVRYWYFRRNGRRWRLPGEPRSAEWLAEYARLKEATDAERKAPKAETTTPAPGSLKAIIVSYYRSPEWKNLKPNSQRAYGMAIASLEERAGHLPIALIERRHIKKLRDELIDKPGMAHMRVKVLRLLIAFAVESGYRKDNPAARIKLPKLGEHRAWTAEELVAFEVRWAPGTMQRRAYALARYTGQRCGDLAGMTRAHRIDGRIRVRQQKTDAQLDVTEHSDLTAELARGEQGHMSLLTKPSGASFDTDSLSKWMGEAIEAAGLPDDCVMHGLRKVAARDLADAGCSLHEIMAITGHVSLTEIARYTKSVNQPRLAETAVRKWEQNAGRTKNDKRDTKRSGKRKLCD